jgi:hypothetical protein
VVVATLAAARLPWPRVRVPLAMVAVLGLALVGQAGAAPPLGERVLAATVEQGPWLLLGAYGLWHAPTLPALALVAGAGGLFLAGPAAADTWTAHAAYRLGLILAATAPVLALVDRLSGALAPPSLLARAATSPRRLGFALLLLAGLPGSFIARWNPPALDPLAAGSRAPLPANVLPGLAFVREQVPPDATCLASPDYAALVAVIGQRRVLRAPALWEPPDDQRRRRAERMLLAGREPELAHRYQIGCVFFANGDVGWLGTTTPDALDRVPGLRPGHGDPYTRVYVLSAAPSP